MRVLHNVHQESPNVIKPNKVNKRLILFFVLLAILFLILIIIFGVSGIYRVPVLSQIFGTFKARDLNIQASEKAFNDFLNKVPIEMIGQKKEFCLLCNRKFEGSQEIDTIISSSEATSFLQHYLNQSEGIETVQVKMIESGMAISAFIKKPLKMPIYVILNINLINPKNLDFEIVKGKIGMVNIPEGYLDRAEDWLNKTFNNRLNKIDGLEIFKLKYTDGHSEFKGIIPERVISQSGHWLNI